MVVVVVEVWRKDKVEVVVRSRARAAETETETEKKKRVIRVNSVYNMRIWLYPSVASAAVCCMLYAYMLYAVRCTPAVTHRLDRTTRGRYGMIIRLIK